jgi:hypothetical protein
LHYIHPSIPFPHILSPSHWYQQPQAGPLLPFFSLVLEKKKKCQCLFEGATQ